MQSNPANVTKQIVIVGLGLIGGSLALALRQQPAYQVFGMDRNAETVELARQAGLDAGEVNAAKLARADIVFLAMSPMAVIAFLEQNAASLRPGTIVTDVCGVKGAVVAPCEQVCHQHGLQFVGGHPMAGKEQSGFAAADGVLFRGASYLLIQTETTHAAALAQLTELAKAVGCARVTVTSAGEHDRMIAFTSQLPHVLAGAYVKSPEAEKQTGFSAGSYRDVSRVASVDEKLWTQLFLLNRAPLCAEINRLIGHLQQYRDAISANDPAELEQLIADGRNAKYRCDHPKEQE